jgi:YfiH family protein
MLYAQHPLSETPSGFGTANQPLPYARHLFGTRAHSHAQADETMHALIERFGPMAWMHQVHGARVVRVEGAEKVPECDALYTSNPELWLAVKTADCVPILVSSPHAVAAVHAGWRSAESGILPATITALCTDFGMGAEDLHLAFGPCLQQDHFEVEASFIEKFNGQFGVTNAARYFRPAAQTGKLLMDLPNILIAQAKALGVLDIHITQLKTCTYTNAAHYHSHRRHTHELAKGIDEPCWRQVSLIRRLAES